MTTTDSTLHQALTIARRLSPRDRAQLISTLVSLDREHLTRLPAILPVLTPADALAALLSPPNAR